MVNLTLIVRQTLTDKFLFRWLCAILILQLGFLELASRPGLAVGSLADLITSETSLGSDYDRDVKKIIQRTNLGLNLEQFHRINNDVELFHRAMMLKLDKLDTRTQDDDDYDGADSGDGDNGINKSIIDSTLAKEASPGLLKRISRAARDVIAPARYYHELIKRYKNWRIEYNKLQKEFGPGPDGKPILKNSLDVLRLEYAKIDDELMSDICFHDPSADASLKEAQSEDVDFILKIIKKLIVRLEKKLVELREKGVERVSNDKEARKEDERAEVRIRDIERSVLVASARAKRIAAHSVANLAAQEFLAVVKILAFNWMASSVSNGKLQNRARSAIGPILSALEPIILLFGSTNTPLLICYLRDIQFRATLNLFNYSTNTLYCKSGAK